METVSRNFQTEINWLLFEFYIICNCCNVLPTNTWMSEWRRIGKSVLISSLTFLLAWFPDIVHFSFKYINISIFIIQYIFCSEVPCVILNKGKPTLVPLNVSSKGNTQVKLIQNWTKRQHLIRCNEYNVDSVALHLFAGQECFPVIGQERLSVLEIQ